MSRVYSIYMDDTNKYYHGVGFTKLNRNRRNKKLSPILVLDNIRKFYDVSEIKNIIREAMENGFSSELENMRLHTYEIPSPHWVSGNMTIDSIKTDLERKLIVRKLKGV